VQKSIFTYVEGNPHPREKLKLKYSTEKKGGGTEFHRDKIGAGRTVAAAPRRVKGQKFFSFPPCQSGPAAEAGAGASRVRPWPHGGRARGTQTPAAELPTLSDCGGAGGGGPLCRVVADGRRPAWPPPAASRGRFKAWLGRVPGLPATACGLPAVHLKLTATSLPPGAARHSAKCRLCQIEMRGGGGGQE
jgi:hypothetical protein